MKTTNIIAQDVLYNSFVKQQQNHLYILVAPSSGQQVALYKWYIKLHVCEHRQEREVCNNCSACQQVEHDNYLNNVVIRKQPEKKSIGIDEVNELQQIFATKASLDEVRFFCIEDADLMTVQAANSVLKFLEEPTGKTIGFLFVKNEQKLLPTIRSRGQIIRLIEEQDISLDPKTAKKMSDPRLLEAAEYLLQIGYDEKTVLKQVGPMYAKIESYCSKIANGSPFIVAQTDLEDFATKTKTGKLILDLFMYVVIEHLKSENQLDATPAHVRTYVVTYAKEFYIAAYHAIQKSRYHLSISMILTSFSLELENRV